MPKRVRCVIEVTAPITEKQLVRIVRENLPTRYPGGSRLLDSRGEMTHGPRQASIKEYSRVVEADRRKADSASTVDLTGLKPASINAIRALVRSLRNE